VCGPVSGYQVQVPGTPTGSLSRIMEAVHTDKGSLSWIIEALKATEGYQRRLVVYIGPPKTASTSLQTFLAKYASPNGSQSNISFLLRTVVYLVRYVMDMAGISQQGLDVCHAVACSIMKVNCAEGNKWV
jgi:hypothetical protein